MSMLNLKFLHIMHTNDFWNKKCTAYMKSTLYFHFINNYFLLKARGLLHQFRLLPRIPCTLSKLCELCGPGMWDSGHVPIIDCSGDHGDHSCPYGGQDPTLKVL